MRCFAARRSPPGKHSTPGAHAPLSAVRTIGPVVNSAGKSLDQPTRDSFAPHFDFSRVRVHTDAEAAASADTWNARAYSIGPHLVFGRNEYAPQTGAGRRLLAHELAHFAQQEHAGEAPRSRVEIGSTTDAAEAQAEAFAKAAVPGNDWSRRPDILPRLASNRGSSEPGLVLRRTPKACEAKSWAGCFSAENYAPTLEADPNTKVRPQRPRFGANIDITFDPNDKADARKIALAQTVQTTLGGVPASIYFKDAGKDIDPDAPDVEEIAGIADLNTATDTRLEHGAKAKKTELSRMVDPSEVESPGAHIDNTPGNRSPLAGLKDPPSGNDLSTAGETATNTFGWNYREKGKPAHHEAKVHDNPGFQAPENVEAEMNFETAALAVEGEQKGAFYGSVRWGWSKGATDRKATLTPFRLQSEGTPSGVFGRATALWNASKTTAGDASVPLPQAKQEFIGAKKSPLLDSAAKGNSVTTLKSGTRVQVTETVDATYKDWRKIVVTDSADVGKSGWIQQDLLSDKPPESKGSRPAKK